MFVSTNGRRTWDGEIFKKTPMIKIKVIFDSLNRWIEFLVNEIRLSPKFTIWLRGAISSFFEVAYKSNLSSFPTVNAREGDRESTIRAL